MKLSTRLARLAPVALVALPAAQTACHSASEETCMGAARCLTLDDDDDANALGVRQVGRPTLGGYEGLCQIVVRRTDGPSAAGFVGAAVARQGEITILDGAIGKVEHCSDDARHARAVLLLDPPGYAWAIPAPGNLFVPFDIGEGTTLSDHSFARASEQHDADNSPIPGRYCVTAGYQDRAETHCDLRIGDAFTWGTRRAEIVRAIPPGFPFAGWLEVTLR